MPVVINRRSGTHPLVIHAHGPLRPGALWERIRDDFFREPPRRLGPVDDLTIMTWNNGHPSLGLLERSLAHMGVPCLVMGDGVPEGAWVNSVHKPRLTAQALAGVSTRLVMGIDSRDALLLGDPEVLARRFESGFDCGLLFSADRLNWPNRPEFREFEDGVADPNDDFRYLNSGAWIGRTDFCGAFFEEATRTRAVPAAPTADQGIFKKLFIKHHPGVQLDYRCSLFQNIGFVLDGAVEVVE